MIFAELHNGAVAELLGDLSDGEFQCFRFAILYSSFFGVFWFFCHICPFLELIILTGNKLRSFSLQKNRKPYLALLVTSIAEVKVFSSIRRDDY